MSRNTKTGFVLERMVLPALEQGGYFYKAQANSVSVSASAVTSWMPLPRRMESKF
jgi:hypothetical protein